MLLLAIDTSLAACSVAFWRVGAVVAERYTAMDRGHAEALLPMIDALRVETGFDLARLDAVAVTLGPGTFTGIRVGLAAARGLALVADSPVIGVSTLAAVAASAEIGPGPPVLVVQDAKRGQAYAELIGPAPKGPVLLDLDDLPAAFPDRPLRLIGSCAEAGTARLGGDTTVAATTVLPRAAATARLAAQEVEINGLPPRAEIPSPLYLRRPDAKLPK